MVDRPIIFSAPMVQALLAGRKTMTRRLAWQACKLCGSHGTCKGPNKPSPWQKVAPGDRLYVRENFSYQEIDGDRIEEYGGVHYWADGNPTFGNWTRPKPSIHMPRVVSRLTLLVDSTKVEPLQSISEADALAEGIEFREGCYGTWNQDGTMRCGGANNAVEAFRCLWLNLHGSGSWKANPEVVAVSLRVEKINIDELEAA